MTEKLRTEKEQYVAPELEIIELNQDEVIFTSQNCPIDYHNNNAYFSGMPVAC